MEFEPVLDLYRKWRPQRVLEVGTYHGGTLYHWLQNACDGAVIVSVDMPPPGTRLDFADWVPKGIHFVQIRGDSASPPVVSQAAEYAPYDWVFIDAGHYYREVVADWQNYGLSMCDDGVVLFHDILKGHGHPEIEVYRLWKEIKQGHWRTQEFIEDPDADWGGIGCVFMS